MTAGWFEVLGYVWVAGLMLLLFWLVVKALQADAKIKKGDQ